MDCRVVRRIPRTCSWVSSKAGLILSLNEDCDAAPWPSVTIETGRDGDNGEVILITPYACSFGFEHADNGVIDSGKFDAFAERGTKGKKCLGQLAPENANIMRAINIAIGQ